MESFVCEIHDFRDSKKKKKKKGGFQFVVFSNPWKSDVTLKNRKLLKIVSFPWFWVHFGDRKILEELVIKIDIHLNNQKFGHPCTNFSEENHYLHNKYSSTKLCIPKMLITPWTTFSVSQRSQNIIKGQKDMLNERLLIFLCSVACSWDTWLHHTAVCVSITVRLLHCNTSVPNTCRPNTVSLYTCVYVCTYLTGTI